VLEITERASLEDVEDLGDRIVRLRRLGYSLAIDDLGAGYAGLASLTKLEPEVVKLDMSLVRGVDVSHTKQHLVSSMVRVCVDLGMLVVTEGVETTSERDTLVSLGCDVLQGYLFSRPQRGFAPVVF
jgi:EAL domain-containing protein (putative c-di-GMP-specific phosphodiesterase class I)